MTALEIALSILLVSLAVILLLIAIMPTGRWVYIHNNRRVCSSCGQVQRMVAGTYLNYGAVVPQTRNCRHDKP